MPDTSAKGISNVLRDIRNLKYSRKFQFLNFGLSLEMRELPNNGMNKSPYYEITKDGFNFLVMGVYRSKSSQVQGGFYPGVQPDERYAELG